MEGAPDVRSVWRSAVGRVLRRRCPQCGRGPLFRGFARLFERCAGCGLVYRREQGAMTGSMYLSAAITELFAAALVFAIFWLTDWGVARSLAVSLPLTLAFCYLFLPYAIGAWVAVEYLTDLGNGEDWVRPER